MSPKLSLVEEKLTTTQEGSAYVTVCPATIATPLFSQSLHKKQDVRDRLQAHNQGT